MSKISSTSILQGTLVPMCYLCGRSVIRNGPALNFIPGSTWGIFLCFQKLVPFPFTQADLFTKRKIATHND